MNSIVLELQKEAMDNRADIGNLLRKALVIATKLQLQELVEWCKAELNGYGQKQTLPNYRVLQGELKVFNPYNGIWMEMVGGSSTIRSGCVQSVAELQNLCGQGDGMLMQTASPEVARMVVDPVTPPRIILSKSSLVGVLDAVRNNILEWTLRLETDGVLGEEMTFSTEEKKTVMNNVTNYHIGSFNGVIGNISSGNVQIGDFNKIESQLKEIGIPDGEREELKQLMNTLPQAKPAEKPNLVARGLAWVMRNAPSLGALSDAIRQWFENQTT